MSDGSGGFERETGRGDWLGLAISLATLVVPLLSAFGAPGAPLDEGLLLTLPELVRSGARPGLDFFHPYGPASLSTLAASFTLFGPSIVTERAVGLAYRVAIVATAWALGRSRSARVGTLCGVTTALMLVPLGLVAAAWFGAVACGLLALLAATNSARGGGRKAAWTAALAGCLAATALSFRPDWALAMAIASLPLILLASSSARLPFALGGIVGLTPLIAWVARVSPQAAWRSLVVEPRLALPARALPLPPRAIEEATLFAIVTVGAVAMLGLGAWSVARAPRDPEARLDLSLGLLAVLLLPQVMQRADLWHMVYAGCISVGLAPRLLARVVELRDRPASARWAAAPLFGLCLLAPTKASGPALRGTLATLGAVDGDVGLVTHQGRSFPLSDRHEAEALGRALADLDARARAGDRVFVGPRDLRRTNYGDTYVYFLLPGLAAASYYALLNPLDANLEGSRLAADVASADFLLLSSRYDDWDEPNASREYGSDAPSRVVRERFCPASEHRNWKLYERCPLRER